MAMGKHRPESTKLNSGHMDSKLGNIHLQVSFDKRLSPGESFIITVRQNTSWVTTVKPELLSSFMSDFRKQKGRQLMVYDPAGQAFRGFAAQFR